MHFVSTEFFVLFAVVLLLLVLLTHRLQNLVLLCASYIFYGWWDWRFLSLIVLSSLIDYGCGLQIDRFSAQSARRMVDCKIGALPVTAQGKLLGIITETDLLKALVADGER